MSGTTTRRAVAGGLAALTLLAGCTLGPSQRPDLAVYGSGPATPATTAPPGSSAVGPGGPGQRAQPIRWERCSDVADTDPATGQQFDVDCATVLTDGRAVGGSGRRSIEVARARAAGVADDAPVLLVLQDSPGAHGRSDVAAVAAGLSAAVRQHFAVVTVDLVGSGDSDPIDCVSGSDLSTVTNLGADPAEPKAAAALSDVTRSITFACTDAGGPDLPLVNSTEAADDLDHLRAALGTDRMALLGRGFGATLGAVYADRYPGRVQSAVLDAPSNPLDSADSRATAVAVAAEKSLDGFAAACPTFTGGCPLGDNPRAAVEQLVERLDASTNPGTRRTTGGTVLLALLLRLGDPDSWPQLATALASAGQGTTGPLTDLVESSLAQDPAARDSTGWFEPTLIYACNDDAVRLTGDSLTTAVEGARTQAPLFGPYTVGLAGLCGSWPAPESALGGVKANGAAPILVVGAVADPVAPYPAVRALAGQLSSSTLLSWQSGRHGSYPASACVGAAVDDYLIRQQLPPVGTLCPP
ncbi:alpha/beta hydrolase [Nakamurella sp.]|uniref:alpha/beta hydrolase n=1 Tax=Nakamurella sp. TaxID=1869182 RepID=UPI003784DD96